MDKYVLLIHGFNVWEPQRTVGKLTPYFEQRGFITEIFRYGHTGLGDVRKRNMGLAKKVAQKCLEAKARGYKVYIVGHSNGAAIIHLAAEHYALVADAVSLINPALNNQLHPCITSAVSQVYHNYEDRPVRWAKWLSRVLPWFNDTRPWGDMGCVGYQGAAMDVYNRDTINEYPECPARGHSGVFHKNKITFFGPVIASGLEASLEVNQLLRGTKTLFDQPESPDSLPL